jgi:hypothetical protein
LSLVHGTERALDDLSARFGAIELKARLAQEHLRTFVLGLRHRDFALQFLQHRHQAAVLRGSREGGVKARTFEA